MGIVAGLCMADPGPINDIEWKQKENADKVMSLQKKASEISLFEGEIQSLINKWDSDLMELKSYTYMAQSNPQQMATALPKIQKQENVINRKKEKAQVDLRRNKAAALVANEQEKQLQRDALQLKTQAESRKGMAEKGNKIIEDSNKRFFS